MKSNLSAKDYISDRETKRHDAQQNGELSLVVYVALCLAGELIKRQCITIVGPTRKRQINAIE